jgi:hypothetical protein
MSDSQLGRRNLQLVVRVCGGMCFVTELSEGLYFWFSVGFMVMSYPGRPPMVPGIPAMPPTMAMPYMQLGGESL